MNANANTRIQILTHKYKHTNTNTKTHKYKHTNTNTNSQMQIQKHTNILQRTEKAVCFPKQLGISAPGFYFDSTQQSASSFTFQQQNGNTIVPEIIFGSINSI